MKINGAAGTNLKLKRPCYRAWWVLDARIPLAIRRLRTPLNYAMGVVLLFAWFGLVSAAIPAPQQRVPAVGCPANDQIKRTKLQTTQPRPAPVPQGMTEQLAYYRAEGSPGVY